MKQLKFSCSSVIVSEIFRNIHRRFSAFSVMSVMFMIHIYLTEGNSYIDIVVYSDSGTTVCTL